MASSQDPGARGPWAVGAKTVTIDGLTTEVWYPVRAADVEGASKAQYDFRTLLPPGEAAKIPDEDNPWLDCECVRDAPLDDQHGPYPVIVFVHDTGGFRFQSLAIVTHWVTHGFVVVAADHPGSFLGDLMEERPSCGGAPQVSPAVSANIDSELAALETLTGELTFLAGHVDVARVGLAGHGTGASEAADASEKPNVRVVVSMIGDRPVTSSTVEGSMFFSSGINPPGWMQSVTPSWLVMIGEGSQADYTHEGTTNAQGQNFREVATEHGVCDPNIGGNWACSGDQCSFVGPGSPTIWSSVGVYGSLILRRILQCQQLEIPETTTSSEVKVVKR